MCKFFWTTKKLIRFYLFLSFSPIFFNFLKSVIGSQQKLGGIFNTKGEKEKKDAKSFTLFYDFEPGTKSPLLLFIKNI